MMTGLICTTSIAGGSERIGITMMIISGMACLIVTVGGVTSIHVGLEVVIHLRDMYCMAFTRTRPLLQTTEIHSVCGISIWSGKASRFMMDVC